MRMGKVIAVSGKGGVGKTVVASLTIKFLLKEKDGSILAVDADPSCNLHIALGIERPKMTLGSLRERAKRRPKSFDLSSFIEYGINMAIVEGRCDLLSVGRPEGKGCYCAVNSLLRESLGKLSKDYDYIVIDNEAGLEHISRQTDASCDIMFIIANPTPQSLATSLSIMELIRELENEIKETYIILNRAETATSDMLDRLKNKVQIAGLLRTDPSIYEAEREGRSLLDLPEDSQIYCDFKEILSGLI
jgi:CO dehydrogenase maturation factor